MQWLSSNSSPCAVRDLSVVFYDPYQARQLAQVISRQQPLKNDSHQLSFTGLCKQDVGLFMTVQDWVLHFCSGEHQYTVKTVEHEVNKAM